MSVETTVITPERRSFAGAGLEIVGDVLGNPGRQPVLLLHGGGQTRHSWAAATLELARRGYYAVAIDLRGHGDSGWAVDGDYGGSAFRDDVVAVAAQLSAPPVLVGASLGGISALLAIGETDHDVARGLVLVDVTPRIERTGSKRIRDFMGARPEGFGSLEEVADAIAGYNPTRSRPRDLSGLLKNVRERDGRYFWHWDPAFLLEINDQPSERSDRQEAAAARITLPTRLVRGGKSDIVSDATVANMRELMPQADVVDIAGAGHMVAGDRNDAFNAAVFSFLEMHGL